jgi:hypothetical protein
VGRSSLECSGRKAMMKQLRVTIVYCNESILIGLGQRSFTVNSLYISFDESGLC